MADLSDREWQLLQAMRNHQTMEQVADEWGTTRQNVDQRRRALERKGVIQRRTDLPLWVRYSETYPWVIRDDVDVRYRPAVPPEVEFRVRYPTDSRTDLTVPPIRVVRWDAGGFTVQGLPACRPDGKPVRLAVPEYVVVWCSSDVERDWTFVAPLKTPWLESYTVEQFVGFPAEEFRLGLGLHQRVTLTHMIAAAIGVDAVLDLSNVTPPGGRDVVGDDRG